MVDPHSNSHTDESHSRTPHPELQQLAQTVLAVIDPLIQAVTTSKPTDGKPGKCEQTWCPVCAVAAIAAGETHPLAAIVAEHGAALLAVIRAVATPTEPDAEPPPDRPSGYQPIPVTIYE